MTDSCLKRREQRVSVGLSIGVSSSPFSIFFFFSFSSAPSRLNQIRAHHRPLAYATFRIWSELARPFKRRRSRRLSIPVAASMIFFLGFWEREGEERTGEERTKGSAGSDRAYPLSFFSVCSGFVWTEWNGPHSSVIAHCAPVSPKSIFPTYFWGLIRSNHLDSFNSSELFGPSILGSYLLCANLDWDPTVNMVHSFVSSFYFLTWSEMGLF
jgi:hypothetical protein